MYDHWIELTLRDIIMMGRYLRGETPGAPFHHEIKNLWSEAKGIIRRFVKEVPESDLDDVTESIGEIAGLTPAGVVGRFPMTKDGSASFAFDTPSIDLDDLRARTDRLEPLLQRPLELLAREVDLEADYRHDAYGE